MSHSAHADNIYPWIPGDPIFESIALGAMMQRIDAMDYGMKHLKPRMLSCSFNRRVLLAIGQVAKRVDRTDNENNITVDVLVAAVHKGWPNPNAHVYIRECVNNCVSPLQFKAQIDLVASMSRRKHIASIGEWLRIGDWCFDMVHDDDSQDDERMAATIIKCVEDVRKNGYCDPEKVYKATK